MLTRLRFGFLRPLRTSGEVGLLDAADAAAALAEDDALDGLWDELGEKGVGIEHQGFEESACRDW